MPDPLRNVNFIVFPVYQLVEPSDPLAHFLQLQPGSPFLELGGKQLGFPHIGI
jgi:hypothetical protein